MKNRKVITLVMVALFAFSASGCSQSTKGNDNIITVEIRKDGDINDSILKKSSMEKEMIELALSCKDLYGSTYSLGEYDPYGDEIRKIKNEVIMYIADRGFAVIGNDNSNMKNCTLVDDFLNKALDGQEVDISYYYVFNNGEFSRTDFHSKDKVLTMTTAQLWWNRDMKPVVGNMVDSEIIQWEYTEKGYFFYETNLSGMKYENNNAVRVKPLREVDLEMCEKYISPIGYQGNNLFLTDWEQTSLEQIDFNDLFEFLYYINYGEIMPLDIYRSSIPADTFEPLVMKYFNVTAQFLKNTAIYFSDTNGYFWTYLSCPTSVYPAPFPEVVDSYENVDGTITIVVDAVFREYGDDCAFTHEVTIKTNDDDGFQYHSNRIRPEDKGSVPAYTSRYTP